MLQPLGFHDKDLPMNIYHLRKSLYGLKQSPRAWFKRLHDFLLKVNFHEGLSDTSLFIYDSNETQIYLMVYFDDIVVTGSSPSSIHQIISKLSKELSIKNLGSLTFFLGIHVCRSDEGLFLSQQQYVTNLLNNESLSNLKPATSPMEPKIDLTQSKSDYLSQEEATRYHRILERL